MINIKDQIGNNIPLEAPAKRIVSLVPSITELLWHLDLNDETIGITKFCVRPAAWFQTKQRIGGTKDVHIDKISSLDPDLIIANKEENVAAQVYELQKICPVYVSDVFDLPSAYNMILNIGSLTGKEAASESLMESIQQRFSALPILNLPPKVCYLIWQKPYMTVGGDTFISQLLKAAGFENSFDHLERYPEVSMTDILEAGCDVIFLSSEPFPFQPRHAYEIEKELAHLASSANKSVPAIQLVDGEMFSWYGSRLLEAPAYFEKLQQVLI